MNFAKIAIILSTFYGYLDYLAQKGSQTTSDVYQVLRIYLFENFFTVLSALFWAFLGRVAVYLLRTVESSGLLYAVGCNSIFS